MEATEIYYRMGGPVSRGKCIEGPRQGPFLMNGRFADRRALSSAVAERLLPAIYRCCGLGFHAPWFAVRENDLAPWPDACAILRHGSGNAVARVTCGGSGKVTVSFLTRLRCGGGILSFNRPLGDPGGAKECAWPRGIHAYVQQGAAPDGLWDFHKRQVALLEEAIPEPLADDVEMVAFCDSLEKTLFEWRLRSGVLIPLTAHEVMETRECARAARDYAARVESAKLAGEETMIALARLTRQPPLRSHSLWAFLLTAIALIVFGFAQPFDPIFLAMAAGAFFFHELGRRVAEWAFRKDGTTGGLQWKQAVISMMGPLPGILAGTLVATFAVSAASDSTRAGQLSLLLLVSNFLTLLPLSSLSGGRFFDAVLFCRNAWLEPMSRAAAGVAVALTAWELQWSFVSFLALWIALSPWSKPRYLGLAGRLRRAIPPLETRGGDAGLIAPEVVAAVVRAVKIRHPRLRDRGQIVDIACRIYETMTARPPSTRVTCCLLALYGVALLLPLAPLKLYVERCPVLKEWARIGNLQDGNLQETGVLPAEVSEQTDDEAGEESNGWELPETI